VRERPLEPSDIRRRGATRRTSVGRRLHRRLCGYDQARQGDYAAKQSRANHRSGMTHLRKLS
jgi:hypothetical protein